MKYIQYALQYDYGKSGIFVEHEVFSFLKDARRQMNLQLICKNGYDWRIVKRTITTKVITQKQAV